MKKYIVEHGIMKPEVKHALLSNRIARLERDIHEKELAIILIRRELNKLDVHS